MIFPDRFETENFSFINYTSMDEEQSRAIWQARNHPDVRKYMTCTDPFSFESHLSFVENLNQRIDRVFYAAVHNGDIAGSICFNPYDENKKEGELGKYMVPEHMGKGLGFLLGKEFLETMFKNGMVKRVIGKTLKNNTRIHRINEKLGMVRFKEDDTYIYWELNK